MGEIMSKLIYRDIYTLETPLGFFCLTDDKEQLPFSVKGNCFNLPYEIYDVNNNIIGSINTMTNYTVVVDTNNLVKGKKYKFHFSGGKWNYCGSDEGTECYVLSKDGWLVGMGSYDPNHEQFDVSKFADYYLEPMSKMDGFNFVLYENCREYIYFNVAWIEIGENCIDDYYGAIVYWLT